MAQVTESFHGSDLEVIAQHYHLAQEHIIPFASNVNPLGISPVLRQTLTKHIAVIEAYPDRNYTALRHAISRYCGTKPEHILPGNGTSDLILRTLKTVRPKQTLIIGPTYSEYGRAAMLSGSRIQTYMLKEEQDYKLDMKAFLNVLHNGIDLLVICNPNNPTGKLLSPEQLKTITTRCAEQGILVLIDETYIEFAKHAKEVSAINLTAQYDNLIVLRSTSKFFAAPGLRLGYAVTKNEILLAAAANDNAPWSINSYAAISGVMFEDTEYITQTDRFIQAERTRIYDALSRHNTIKVYQPDANFILIRLLKEGQTAQQVFEHCIRNGFMIRDCSDYTGLGEQYIRFCFMLPEQNTALLNTLLEIV